MEALGVSMTNYWSELTDWDVEVALAKVGLQTWPNHEYRDVVTTWRIYDY